ncbi:hypothetical protein DH2020_044641 [Rehmannia glutinosa]|uniref:Pentatricopeptide repeat-containing protein n=1 Tax=Rehmannia glutinosa TaxID=99300 RepID=A0ABR0UGD6_REHGL
MLRNALETNLNLVTKLITTLSSADQHCGTRHARRLFDQMPQRSDAFLCNTMMKSHLSSRQFPEAISLYVCLRRKEGFVPDNYTFSTLSKCCGLSFSMWEGVAVHAHVVKYGFKSNLHVATAMVDMYGKLGQMGFARKVFDEMTERSSVSWTALITGYIRVGDMGTAKALFNVMPENERDTAAFNVMIDGYVKLGEMGSAKMMFDSTPEKNVVSWTTMIDGYCSYGDVNEASVLPAIADLGALDLGNWVYEFVKKNKLDRSANVSTALVDMYAKCGEVEKARRVFDDVRGRETCTWNALINGLALNGCAKEALEVFMEMTRKGFKPDEITMLGVLSACNHGGLVDEGKRWFCKMGEFRVTPRIEHYGCLVDLLGRAGRLEEAEKLIESMPYEANGIILSSLLFACGYAKGVARARSRERWWGVERIKRLMLIKGAKKEVGFSAVEIDSRVLEFVAGDKMHPHLEVTHLVLDQLQMHMKVEEPLFDVDCKESEA